MGTYEDFQRDFKSLLEAVTQFSGDGMENADANEELTHRLSLWGTFACAVVRRCGVIDATNARVGFMLLENFVQRVNAADFADLIEQYHMHEWPREHLRGELFKVIEALSELERLLKDNPLVGILRPTSFVLINIWDTAGNAS